MPSTLRASCLVQRHERVCLELRERDVFGVERLRPAELIRHLPGPTPEDGVAEEPDRHALDAGKVLASGVGRELAALDGLVEDRQRLGAQKRRREELVLGRDLDPLARQVEDDAAVDDESRHAEHGIARLRPLGLG